MNQQLIKINGKDYGLEETKAQQVASLFKPMLDKMVELEIEYNGVLKLEISPDTCEKAKELRKKYVKVRTGTAEIHKELKAFYLNGGRFVDGWKNAQIAASFENEEKLKNIEEFYIRQEQERINKIQKERSEILEKYEVDYIPEQLGELKESVWKNYLSGVELAYKNRKTEEEKLEKERLEKEKKEIEEQKRIKAENEKLKKEAAERERIAEIERKKQAAVLESERRKKEEAENKLKAERAERERKEKLEKEKIEREKKEKEELEEKRLAASDSEKFCQLANDIKLIRIPVVQSKESKLFIKQVETELENIVKLLLKNKRST